MIPKGKLKHQQNKEQQDLIWIFIIITTDMRTSQSGIARDLSWIQLPWRRGPKYLAQPKKNVHTKKRCTVHIPTTTAPNKIKTQLLTHNVQIELQRLSLLLRISQASFPLVGGASPPPRARGKGGNARQSGPGGGGWQMSVFAHRSYNNTIAHSIPHK